MTPLSAAGRDRGAYLAWIAICLIWGTTYLAIKIALEGVPPFLIGGVRYVLAGGLLAGWLVATGIGLPPVRLWGRFVLMGALLLGVGNGGVVVAEQWVPSGVAAVVIATTPFWMVGVDAFFPRGESLTRRQWSGLAIGFAGTVLLVWPDLVRGGRAGWGTAAGVLSLQVACAGWSVGSSISKRLELTVSPMQAAAMQMLFGGLWMLAVGTALGEWSAARVTMRASLAVLYLALVGGLGGFGAYIYALSRLPVSFVSLYAYVNPVIAVALGAMLLGEPFTLRMTLAIAVVLAGMALVTSATRGGASAASQDRGSPPTASAAAEA